MPTACAPPIKPSRQSVAEKVGAEHFQGVTVQPMIKLDGYELIIGMQHRRAVWPGAALWHGRAAGRSLQRPRARPAAAEYDAGAAHDGADQDLHGAQRRARAQAGRHRGARANSWCASANWSSSSRGSKRSTSTRCWPRRSDLIALDARVVLHDAETPEDKLPRPAIRPYPIQYMYSMTTARRRRT